MRRNDGRSTGSAARLLIAIALPALLAIAAPARAAPGCLATFEGPVTQLDRDYGYDGFRVASWPSGARLTPAAAIGPA